MAESAKQLIEKYGIYIVPDGYYDLFGKYHKQYAIFTADECRWDVGFKTIKDIESECKAFEKEILGIFENVKSQKTKEN